MINSKIYLRTAIAYIRAFSKESLNAYSLNEQEKAIVDFASRSGYRILHCFRDNNVSAKTFNRPAFKEMVDYIKVNKRRVKFLLVVDITRLSTNPSGLRKIRWFLKADDIKIVSVVQSMLKHTA